jgi:hypothetical protein
MPGDGVPEIEWSCEVFEGQTTRFDLVTDGAEPAVLTGRLEVVGAGVRGWTASMTKVEGGAVEFLHVPLAEDGSFRLEDLPPGRRQLRLIHPDATHGDLRLEVWIELEPGENAWSLRLAAASLTGVGLMSAAGTEIQYELQARPGDAAHPGLVSRVRLVLDASGRFALPFVPAGAITVRRFDPESGPHGGWETVLDTILAPGQARHLDLR